MRCFEAEGQLMKRAIYLSTLLSSGGGSIPYGAGLDNGPVALNILTRWAVFVHGTVCLGCHLQPCHYFYDIISSVGKSLWLTPRTSLALAM